MIDAETHAFPVAEVHEERFTDVFEIPTIRAVGHLVGIGRHVESDAQEDFFCMEGREDVF